MLALAGLSSSIGIFITLYDLIIVGQLIPHYSQYNLVGMPEFYSYTPSLHEYMMVLGTLSFFAAAYILGEIAFNSRSRAIAVNRPNCHSNFAHDRQVLSSGVSKRCPRFHIAIVSIILQWHELFFTDWNQGCLSKAIALAKASVISGKWVISGTTWIYLTIPCLSTRTTDRASSCGPFNEQSH